MAGGQVNAGFIENVHGAIQAQVAYMMDMEKPEVLDPILLASWAIR